MISNKIDDYDLGIVSTLGGLWEPGSGEIQVFHSFWKERKHAVLGNVKFSKVHMISILHILLVNTLNGNVCFDTGLC